MLPLGAGGKLLPVLRSIMPEPLFILAPPRSFTSIVCSMLGQHPQMYSLPETNLFTAETMQGWWLLNSRGLGLNTHGLLRAVAELFFGAQTESSIRMARVWLLLRTHRTTGDVFRELVQWVTPRIVVEKSPAVTFSFDALLRMWTAFPGAKFLTLSRHPRDQCESALSAMIDLGLPESALPIWLEMTGDPQDWWLCCHRNIARFLQQVPRKQKMELRGEDVLADLDLHFKLITKWLGIRSDPAALEQMKHPEESPFSHPGPPSAFLGNDPHLLEQPTVRPLKCRPSSLEGPLSWHIDRREFRRSVKKMAREFGYQ
jgi:hypothetical protein